MKIQILGLALVASAVSFGQDTGSLLVGEASLDASQLSRLVAGRGKVDESTLNGYFRVRSTDHTSLEELRLALRTIDFVLPGDSNLVDLLSYQSVSNHANYLEGAFRIQHGRAPNRSEKTGAEFYRLMAYRLSSRVDPDTGKINSAWVRKAAEHRDRMPGARGSHLDPGIEMQTFAPIQWGQVGPTQVLGAGQPGFGPGPLSGPKTGAAMSPSNPNTVYVSSAGGGLWKSTNGGTTFSPLSHGWQYLNTACVVVHPTNPDIVFAGIGDASGFSTGQTAGIAKSIDGGTTWSMVGSEFADSSVVRITINPSNTDQMLALAKGPSGDIWRSTDAGETWSRTNAPNGDWQDIDRGSDGRLVAVGAGVGLVTSVNYGSSWAAVPSPLLASGSVWDVAVSKVDSGRIYLITSNHQIYRTLTLGVLWLNITLDHDLGLNEPLLNWDDASRGLSVEASSLGLTDIVFTGLKTISVTGIDGLLWIDLTRSLDPGGLLPTGNRFLMIHPNNPMRLVVCGDAGLAEVDVTDAPDETGIVQMNGSFNDVMFNGVAVNPVNRLFLMGGSIGLGTPANLGGPYTDPWRALYGTSGAGSAYDLADPGIHYTSGPGGEVFRYTSNGDLTPDDISPNGGLPISPLVCAGLNGSTPVFGAANGNIRVFNGTVWSNQATGGSAIRTIAVSKWDTGRIYTGAQNGDVYRFANLGAVPTKIDGNLPDRPIGGIAESPYSQDLLLVALQGPGEADTVYRCSNATAPTPIWVQVTGTGATALPEIGANDVEFDPFTNVYYAATDVGVFVSPDAGVRWYNLNSLGLPNVPVSDIFLSRSGSNNFLYAATMGRGVYRLLLSARNLTSVLVFKPGIYGGEQNTITLKLNGSAPIGAITTVTDGTSNVSMPNTVTFPQGSTQLTFTSFSVDPPATETVTVTGRVYGTTATNSFVLHKVPNFTYTPQSGNIYGGDRFSATIDLHEAAPITTVLTFSDTSANIGSPASTSIPLGGQTQTVALHTLPVPSAETATITAKIANTSKTANITLHPRPDLTEVSLNQSSVVGGTTVTGTVHTEFAGLGGAQTVILNDTSTAVSTPGSVVIPNGSSEQTFSIGTNPVGASYNVTIRARLRGTVRTTVLNVHP